MQVFNDPDCVSIWFIECLHLHWNLNKQLHDHDQNLMINAFPWRVPWSYGGIKYCPMQILYAKTSSYICYQVGFGSSSDAQTISYVTLYHTVQYFNNCQKGKLLKTLWGERENAAYQHFLLFPQCFQPFSGTFNLPSANTFNLNWYWIVSFGKGFLTL